jgi:proteasome lid subunit RPN8/RPN11
MLSCYGIKVFRDSTSGGLCWIAFASWTLCACAAGPAMKLRQGEDFGEESERVWVRGSWELIHPTRDIDGVIDQLCPAVMQLDRARDGDDGVEYCGLLYALADGQYYATVPSPLSRSPGQRRNKSCRVPSFIHERQGTPQVACDYHSHPWHQSPLSLGDRASAKQKYSIRIQFDTACHVLKLVPHVEAAVPGEIYERIGGTWRLLAIIPTDSKDSGRSRPPLEEP